MVWDEIEGIKKLKSAEPAFIQVLLPAFKLYKSPSECLLKVEFKKTDKTITGRKTKERILGLIPDFQRKNSEYQQKFDTLLLERSIGSYSYHDPDFRFRYASGGTLPILRLDHNDYFCLFWRDVFPLGWNIANGGCDSLNELLDPTITIHRELREELIIFGLKENKDYVYRSALDGTIDRPEFEMARELWNAIFTHQKFKELDTHYIDVEWIDGPDRLSASLVSEDGITIVTNPTAACFINITARDFSIEIDKIARIPIESDMLLLDGEISDHKILGRPIGLFEVDRMLRELETGQKDFFPDLIYFMGYPGPGGKDETEDIIFHKHLPRLGKVEIRDSEHPTMVRNCSTRYELCPITSRMIARYAGYREEKKRPVAEQYDVFISHATEDRPFVNRLRTDLERTGFSCFIAPECLKSGEKLLQGIFRGISKSRIFLIVLSANSIRNQRGWVLAEFEEAHRLEMQDKDTEIIIPIRLDDTPFEVDEEWINRLLSRQIDDFKEDRYQTGLERLIQALRDKQR